VSRLDVEKKRNAFVVACDLDGSRGSLGKEIGGNMQLGMAFIHTWTSKYYSASRDAR
jgi:hypothetical protein